MRPLIAFLLACSLLLTSCSDDSPSASDGTSAAAPTTADGGDSGGGGDDGDDGDEATPPPTVDQLLAMEEPLVIAHAGGDQDHPHSTAFAYAESVAAGAHVLELDVQLTADGVLVVQHDDTVDKTTNETGPVIDRRLTQLQELDNAYWFSPECWPCHDLADDAYPYRGVRTGDVAPPDGYAADDFRVETLEAVATRFPSHFLDIEIKGDGAAGVAVANALAAELRDLGRENSSIVVSFNSAVLDAFRAAAPEVATSPGVDAMLGWYLGTGTLAPSDRVLQVPPFFEGIEVLTPEFVGRAHDEGYEVWVWMDDAATQENAEFYGQMLELGVDGLLVGRPAAAAAAVDAAG